MEPHGSPPASSREVKFAPKSHARRKLSTRLKREAIDEDDEAEAASEAQTLLRQFNENRARRGPKSRKKTEVVFGAGAQTSSSIRSFGTPKLEGASKSSNKESCGDDQIPTLSPAKIAGDSQSSDPVRKKEYRETWDCDRDYYPIVLPMRRPCSEEPEIVDEDELGEAATTSEHKQNSPNPASELGLLEENVKGKMLFFQLPPALPMAKQAGSTKAKEKSSSSSSSTRTKPCTLDELPAGYLGKMLVYKSGAVKLKLGNTPFDVSPGINTNIPKDVVAINTAEKQCCVLGKLGERATVTPDLQRLLSSVVDLG